MAATARSSTSRYETSLPKAEYYATIKGPNYDNIMPKNENWCEELATQVKQRDDVEKSQNFYGMTDEELLMNRALFQKMGLLNA